MGFTKKQKRFRYLIYGTMSVLVVGFFVVTFTLQYLEKRNFTKAEASLDALAQQIQDKVGKADEVKKEKSCGRANLKSEKGPLLCNVSTRILFANSGLNGSRNLMKSISENFTSKIRIGSGASVGLDFVSKNEVKSTQIFYQDLPDLGGLTCAVGYRYPSGIEQTDATPQEEGFAVSLSCGGPAITEYFPLRD